MFLAFSYPEALFYNRNEKNDFHILFCQKNVWSFFDHSLFWRIDDLTSDIDLEWIFLASVEWKFNLAIQ